MLCSLGPLRARVAHKNSATTTAPRHKALVGVWLVAGEVAMTDNPTSFLAAGITLADNAIKSLQEWRGFLDTLSTRVAEVEGLKQQIAAEKTQLASVRAQREVGENELEETKQRLAQLMAEVFRARN
jgi:hypothetical protein